MNNKKIRKITSKDSSYPFLLKQISDPPANLYILGNLSNEKLPHLAIVGTRKATPNGCLIARTLARELSEAGCVIVSGLAMGIDTAAHEGVVAAKGKTLAVLGNGLNKIYPSQNKNLAEKILELDGAIISEYAPDEPAFPSNFLARNRIVSGLCLATIVVEAPERSGSLVTARLALEQNREVFIVPGPANHYNYAGSHRLIREGARLAISAKDILDDLNIKPITSKENFSPEEELILKIFPKNKKSLSIDKIIELTKLDSQVVNKTIAFLVIKGIIKENLGRYNLK
ncbi:MAG: DNA-processing protein DprA [bacterium]|nr:DNA-processing protein DprA [bacterium]